MEFLPLIVFFAFIFWVTNRYIKLKRHPKPLNFQKSAKNINLSALPEQFIVLDFETTGLSPTKNKIIEIGAIKVNRDSNKHETFQSFIKIDGDIPAKITELTGITTEILKLEGEPIESVLPTLIEFIGDLRIVAFNAKFDMAFLHESAKSQGFSIKNKSSCALDMARRAWPGKSSYKLSSLADDFGLKTQNHRALQDCELALSIYVAACDELKCAW